MNFGSDNLTGASEEIINAVVRANAGLTNSYGGDLFTARVETQLTELFETELTAFLVATGTAANALALSVMTPPYGAVLCHWNSHIFEDECGAPEFFTNGARMIPVSGSNGKMDLDDFIAKAGRGQGDIHSLQPSAASITQITELGSIYSKEEIAAIADACHSRGLTLHMDGARFANAVAAMDTTPAEISWKAGVDAMTFGATKNGAMGVEAVIFFDRQLAQNFALRRKRAGHLFSKMRFLSAQMEAYLTDCLWLNNARHANAMANRLLAGLTPLETFEFPYTGGGNMLFLKLPTKHYQALKKAGFTFYRGRWEEDVARLVTAFNTCPGGVDALIEASSRVAGQS